MNGKSLGVSRILGSARTRKCQNIILGDYRVLRNIPAVRDTAAKVCLDRVRIDEDRRD